MRQLLLFGALILGGVALVTAAIVIGGSFLMWDGNCFEDNPKVAAARAMTEEQLATLNQDIRSLPTGRTIHSDDIPTKLKFLKARYISLEHGEPYVVLAKCDVSEGITLWFEQQAGKQTITLTFLARETGKFSEKEVLWISK